MKKTLLTMVCCSVAMLAGAQVPYNTSKSPAFNEPASKAITKSPARQVEKPVQAPLKANYILPDVLPDRENMVYGYVSYDHERWMNQYSLVKFQTNVPQLGSMTRLAEYCSNLYDNWVPDIKAMTFVGDKLYAMLTRPFNLGYYYLYGLAEIDLNDGSHTMVHRFFNWSGDPEERVENKTANPNYPLMHDMSYDPTTNVIWGIAPELGASGNLQNLSAWNLAYIDLNEQNPVPTVLRKLDKEISCLTADHGKVYGIENDYVLSGYNADGSAIVETLTSLVEITPNIILGTFDKRTRREYDANELVVMGQYNPSSLEIDRDNRRMYITYTDDLDFQVYFAELSMFENNFGKVLKKTRQGGDGFGMGCLALPFQMGVADNAPANITNLKYVAPEEGVANACFTWDLPTGCYYDREKNPELQGIHVYRNGELAYDLPANTRSLEDNDIPFNLYQYVFVPYNAAGEGLKEARTIFVGKDAPGAPLNVTLTGNHNVATLTWDAPTTGAHGSYFDKESVTYTVVRNPGNVTVAEGLKETTYSEPLPGRTTGYSYNVMSVNAQGSSSFTTSNIVAIGDPETIPTIFDFEKKGDYDMWTVLDNNQDGFKWTWGQFWYDVDAPYYCAYYEDSFCSNQPSDYLFSPLLALDPDKEYKLSYNVMTHNYIYDFDAYGDPVPTYERFGWYIGPEDMMPGDGSMNRFDEGSYSSKEGLRWYYRHATFQPDEEISRIAFSCLSDGAPNNTGYLKLGKVILREYTATDVAAYGMRCDGLTGKGNPFKVQVAIKNEGSAAAKGVVVNIYDQDDNLVQTATISQAIPSEEEVIAEIECVINKAGNYTLHSEVVLNGDTYPADNACPYTCQIEVNGDAEGEWKVIGEPNEYVSNWCNMTYAYSQSQALYLADELGLKKGDQITAIGFVYQGNPNFADMTDVEFEVSLGSTNLNQIYSYYDYMWDWNFYPKLLGDEYFDHYAFFGLVDANCTEGEGQIVFNFTDPYIYNGRNLLMNIVRTKSSNVTKDLGWHLFQMRSLDTTDDASVDPKGRAVTYYGDDVPKAGANARGYGNNDIPVLYLCYRDITGVSHISTIDGKLRIDSREGEMTLSEECTNIVLTDMQGRTIATSAKGRTINVPAGTNGVCTVSAVLPNGQMKSLKVIVK